MLEDLRKQDAMPNWQEIESTAAEPLPLIARLAIAYAVAVVIGMGLLAG